MYLMRCDFDAEAEMGNAVVKKDVIMRDAEVKGKDKDVQRRVNP